MLIFTLIFLIVSIILLHRLKSEQKLMAPKSYLTKLQARPRSSNY